MDLYKKVENVIQEHINEHKKEVHLNASHTAGRLCSIHCCFLMAIERLHDQCRLYNPPGERRCEGVTDLQTDGRTEDGQMDVRYLLDTIYLLRRF